MSSVFSAAAAMLVDSRVRLEISPKVVHACTPTQKQRSLVAAAALLAGPKFRLRLLLLQAAGSWSNGAPYPDTVETSTRAGTF
jgi:hypothetical protein